MRLLFRLFAGVLIFGGCLVLSAADGATQRERTPGPDGLGAQVYYVSLAGDDRNAGTEEKPFRTIQKAAEVVQAGETVIVKAGVYRERVEVKRSGKPGKPITFQGETGAVVDGGDVIRGWEPAPEKGAGVYRKAHAAMGYKPSNLTWNNKYVVWVNDEEKQTWEWLAWEASAPQWDGVEALAGNSGEYAYVKFRKGQDPDGEDVTFAPKHRGAFNLDGKNFIVVRGFVLRNAWNALRVTGGASDNIIESNKLVGGQWTLLVSNGSSRNHIRRNELTLDYVYEDVGHPRRRSRVDFQVYSFLRSRAQEQIHDAILFLNGGADNHVYENHIYRHFAGVRTIGTGATDDETKKIDLRLKVYRNRIHHVAGYALLPSQSGLVDSEWHDNELYEANAIIRSDTPYFGPIYIYRNRVHHLTQAPLDTYTGDAAEGDLYFNADSQAKIYVYHNSVSGAAYGLVMGNRPGSRSNTNIWFINNVFSAKKFYVYYGPAGDPGNGHFDYNWIGGAGARRLEWMGSHNVVRDRLRLWEPVEPSFILPAESGAREAGINLSKPWTLDGVTHPALPGMKPGYFSPYTRPDLGAVQRGAVERAK